MRLTEYRRTRCPYCGGTEHRIYGTRKQGTVIVRYHRCDCGKCFSTREIMASWRDIGNV